jgi:two-component system OmpR family sensor kinase
MHKLFRKMFAMIWLCTAGSIVLLFVIVNWFSATPFAEELRQSTRVFALNTAAGLLEQSDLESTKVLISAARNVDPAIHLTVTPLGSPIECAVVGRDPMVRRVVNASTCYLLTAESEHLGFLSRQWPKLIPLASALVAAAGAAFWLANYFTGPIEELQMGLRELARGRFQVRISKRIDRKRDELAALATDFDVTAARLQEFQDNQQRLFHDVSHELRSPLSRLQAGIGILRKNPLRLEAMLERVDREIERMDGLVGEILTLAKLTTSELQPLECQTVDLVDLIKEIVADSAFEGSARSINVSYEGEATFVTSVNGELIYRAVENVIRNAVKFSPPNSDVSVRTCRADTLFIVSIEDRGIGVPEDALATIFQTFKRIGDGSSKATGYGLGLSITKQAFERHGGSVRAELAESGGLRISLSLPLS